jgi:hypothetical protein
MVHVPDTLDELMTPEWLSTALGVRFPGIKVTSVIRGPVISLVATNARFRSKGEGGGARGPVP